MKKNKIIITGGAGFVGTNLINHLLKKTKYKIISIDNYSSGFKKNHIKNKRITYLKGETKNISSFFFADCPDLASSKALIISSTDTSIPFPT